MTKIEIADGFRTRRAQEFTSTIYSGKIRKNGEPCIKHLSRVEAILKRINAPDEARAAAFLHDILEDTDTTRGDLLRAFGCGIAGIVWDVTEHDKTLPWRERKESVIDNVVNMGKNSLLVKTADRIDNLTRLSADLLANGLGFMNRFHAPLPEQIEMSAKLLTALRERWPENPLLPDLQQALNAICYY